MWILTVAVVVALALSVFNLTLIFAVVRRLRDAPAPASAHGSDGHHPHGPAGHDTAGHGAGGHGSEPLPIGSVLPAGIALEPGTPVQAVAVGERVGAFRVAALDGTVLTQADVAAGDSTVIFLSASCSACEQVQEDLERRQDTFGGSLIVFVIGREKQVAAIGARLPAARVAPCALGDDVSMAFGGVDGYPRVMRVTDGVIAAGGFNLDHLRGVHRFVAGPA